MEWGQRQGVEESNSRLTTTVKPIWRSKRFISSQLWKKSNLIPSAAAAAAAVSAVSTGRHKSNKQIKQRQQPFEFQLFHWKSERMKRNEMEWNGMKRNEMEWNGSEPLFTFVAGRVFARALLNKRQSTRKRIESNNNWNNEKEPNHISRDISPRGKKIKLFSSLRAQQQLNWAFNRFPPTPRQCAYISCFVYTTAAYNVATRLSIRDTIDHHVASSNSSALSWY